MISIGTIDLKKHFKTLGAGNTRMKSSISHMKKEQYAGKSSTIAVTSIDKPPLRRGDTMRRGIPSRKDSFIRDRKNSFAVESVNNDRIEVTGDSDENKS